jgi:hypothetical protein
MSAVGGRFLPATVIIVVSSSDNLSALAPCILTFSKTGRCKGDYFVENISKVQDEKEER